MENSRNQDFSYYFCLIKEGSGSVHLTNGSGSESRWPRNKRIRIWIQVAQKQKDLTDLDPEHLQGDGNYPDELVIKIHVQYGT